MCPMDASQFSVIQRTENPEPRASETMPHERGQLLHLIDSPNPKALILLSVFIFSFA
jgi:hypothetical protein